MAAHGADPPRGTAGTVIAGLDGSAADEPVVDRASDEAAWLGAPLRLVSAVDPGLQLTPYEALATGSPSLADHLEEGAHHVLERAAARVDERHPGLDVALAVPWGPPATTLVRLSDGARRVVVGAPGHGRLQRLFMGSVALPVVAHAHCPVVVVPATAEIREPRRIVVAVDGSEGSAEAIDLALATAEATGAHVVAVLGWNLEVHDGVVVSEPGSRLAGWPSRSTTRPASMPCSTPAPPPGPACPWRCSCATGHPRGPSSRSQPSRTPTSSSSAAGAWAASAASCSAR